MTVPPKIRLIRKMSLMGRNPSLPNLRRTVFGSRVSFTQAVRCRICEFYSPIQEGGTSMRKLAFALAIPALIAAVPALAGPFGGVHVAVNRHEYRGNSCPVEVVFTASVNITNDHGPGLAF